MLSGLGWLFLIGGIAWLIALTLGTVLGIMRTLPNKPLQTIASAYVSLFRNVPLLVQLFIWYYVVPGFFPKACANGGISALRPTPSAMLSASVGLGLFTAAAHCRAGAHRHSVAAAGQSHAAYALGFSTAQVYRQVLLPQAFRVILPPMSSELTNCFKNASVASLVGVAELISQTKTIAEYTQNNFEIYTYATLIYLVINLVLIMLMGSLERKYRVPGLMAEGK